MATNNDILAALNEIIDKIGAIDPCTPVSVHLPDITLACGNCGGIAPESPEVTQGDPPPAGYEPDPGIDARKCKAANYIHDQIYNLIFTLNQIGVDTILGFAYAQQNQMIYTALFGAGILANVFAFVANVVDEMVKYINDTTVTLSSVLSAMDAGKTDLVCTLYNAQSSSQAKNDYIAELQNQGITDAETIAVFGYFLINDVTRMLFHAIPGSEAALDGYVSTVDCAQCVQTVYLWQFTTDAEQWQFSVVDCLGGSASGFHNGSGELQTNITKTSAKNCSTKWRSPNLVEIVNGGVTKLRARINLSNDICCGIRLQVIFSDGSFASKYFDIGTGYAWWEYTLEMTHNLKIIDWVQVETHSGSSCSSGSTSFYIDEIELTI